MQVSAIVLAVVTNFTLVDFKLLDCSMSLNKMLDTLRLLMSRQLKHFKLAQKTSGFTLLELLVAMVLAVLVITPLLTFMVNIMDNDNKEQAKAASEQEIQSTLDYISQDLEQAVYIYDADGLNNKSNDSTPGIKDQIPPLASAPGCGSTTTTCVPVLVFWKRNFKQGVVPVTVNWNTLYNDTFVYSLVAYYLIQGTSVDGNWSNAARIGRFEIRDGVTDPANPTNADGTAHYITPPSTQTNPSPGFQLFNLTLTGQGLKTKMDLWQKNTQAAYTDQTVTMVDYIDQTQNPTGTCPATNPQQVTGGFYACCPANMQQIVPPNLAGGFYACVNSSTTSAQIYIRGNALARITTAGATYSDSKSIYFPTASIQIKGRGLLSTN